MPIGDIQLNHEGMVPDQPEGRDRYEAAPGMVIGEKPTDKPSDTPEELTNTALPREQVEQFMFEIMSQPAWRREADRACDYYDGNQLSPETVEKMQDRHLPPLISNLIKPTIDTVLGMEAKTRTDWLVREEDDDECTEDMAEGLSYKLKKAETESRADRACSDAYAAQLKAGLGWIEVAREHDPFKAPYRVRYVHRREIFWDWRAEQPDLSDARYLIRRRWLELDHAISMFPMYATLLRMCTSGWSGFDPLVDTDTKLVQSWEIERDTKMSATDWRDVQRERVCLSEIWYRKWVRGYVMRLPNGTVKEVDFKNRRHAEAIVAGYVQVKQATFQKVRLAWYVGPHFLFDVPSPYDHQQFPYVPFFGYREDQTGVPYGLVRSMISPQDEVNARKAKMLHALNSRRVVADSDAVKDHRKAAREVSRSDAYIVLDANRKPSSQFRIEPAGDLAAQQFQVMQEAKQEIAESSGIHKTMMGQQSGATSGLAINSLVEQGLNTLAEINDNYRFARRLVGELLFQMVKQDMEGSPKKVSIGQGKKKKVIVFNQPAIDPETGMRFVINDVAKVNPKVVLDDIPSTPTYRMQQLQMLTEVTKSLPPNLQGFVIDFIVEATDMPRRHEVADRLRAAIGVKDEEQQNAENQAQQEALAQQQDQAQKLFVLDAAERAARVRKLNAEATRIMAQARQPQVVTSPAAYALQ